MLVRQSADLHGDGSADEVQVVFDKDGAAHSELLRDVPDLARRYRQLRRDQRTAEIARRTAVDAAHQAARTIRQQADDALAAARLAHEQAITAANEEFQTALDGATDVIKASDTTRAAAKTAIDDDAFTMAEEIIAARETPAAPIPDDTI